jgi:exosome complex component RRP42
MSAIDVVKVGYIKELLAKDVREDSRGLMDGRKVIVKCNVIENAEGSAQVDMGNTRVMVGVKFVLEAPKPDTPNMGNLVMSAELLPLANPQYEPGPPSPEAIELARVVDRGIRAGNCINLEGLFVEDGKAWSAYVDIYVLNYDGNLFDASSMAAMAALASATVPGVKDGVADYSDKSSSVKLDNIVTSTTFGKIGGKMLFDMTGNEEAAADARVTIETDGNSVRAMQKGMSGSFTLEELNGLVAESLSRHSGLKKLIEASAKQ